MNRRERRAATRRQKREAPASPPARSRAAAPRRVGIEREAEADATFARILRAKPDHPEALQHVAKRAYQAGKHGVAVDLLKKALAARPDFAEAHYNLGNVLREQGKLEEALACYRKAIALRPDFVQAHTNLGTALEQQGRLEEAIGSFNDALALDPNFALARYNLGNAYRERGDLDQALACYRRVLGLWPSFADAYNALGIALKRKGELEEAVRSFRKAVALKPDFAAAHNNLGNAFEAKGRFEEAIASFNKALALKPDFAEAHNNLGYTLQAQGRLREAAASFASALAARPSFAEAHRNLASLRRYTTRDSHVESMERLLAQSSIDDEQRIYLCFALAKAYDDLGDYDGAFAHLERGNRLKRALIDFDVSEREARAERIVSVFDDELAVRTRGQGSSSGVPIFVIGMPRSGTTLVEQILASHPEVHGAGELPILNDLATGLKSRSGAERRFPEAALDLDRRALKRLGEAYVERLRECAPAARHVTDKEWSNFFYVGLIHQVLPNARIIHCVRDPVDTCFSCFSILFDRSLLFSYDLTELGRYYSLYHRLMRHWDALLPGRMLNLCYESLIADQERETRRLLEFCDLPWDDACLSFHETERPVRTASAAQIRRPLYRSSVGRWKRYESHLKPLLKALVIGDSI